MAIMTETPLCKAGPALRASGYDLATCGTIASSYLAANTPPRPDVDRWWPDSNSKQSRKGRRRRDPAITTGDPIPVWGKANFAGLTSLTSVAAADVTRRRPASPLASLVT